MGLVGFQNFQDFSDIYLNSDSVRIKSITQNTVEQDSFNNYVRFSLVWILFLLDFIGLSSVNISDVKISAYSSVDV